MAPSAAIAYPAQVRFAAPPVTPTAVQADLRGVIDRTPTSMLANPAGVQVQVADGNTVVLRGAVRDEDEARLVEGLVRLTPGVRGIKNELSYPRP
ncbi:MAG: BON domain-containing protein [Gemmataceae bacterium]|nr:BON domain-containing protein [Gemmataceae bacterium]